MCVCNDGLTGMNGTHHPITYSVVWVPVAVWVGSSLDYQVLAGPMLCCLLKPRQGKAKAQAATATSIITFYVKCIYSKHIFKLVNYSTCLFIPLPEMLSIINRQ